MIVHLPLLPSHFNTSNTDKVLRFSDDYITAPPCLPYTADTRDWLQVKGQVNSRNAVLNARGCEGGRQWCPLSVCGVMERHAAEKQFSADFPEIHKLPHEKHGAARKSCTLPRRYFKPECSWIHVNGPQSLNRRRMSCVLGGFLRVFHPLNTSEEKLA